MKNIYDNGAELIGNIDDVIKSVEYQLKEDIDMLYADKEELLEELKELKKCDTEIVMVDYDTPMGYTIYAWNKIDVIKEDK